MLTHDEVFAVIVGRTLRYARRHFDLDQDFLAERINLSQPGVSKIERLGRCGLPMFYKYCVAIEKTPKYIMDSASALLESLLNDSKDDSGEVPKKLDWTPKAIAIWCDKVFEEWDKGEDAKPIVILEEEEEYV